MSYKANSHINTAPDVLKHTKKTAIIMSALILMLFLFSCLYIYLTSHQGSSNYTAYIYQNGQLLQTIDLSQVEKSYCFTVTSENNGINNIQVEKNAISVREANCPDKVCVHQGSIRNSLLPITCLPHGLVIELKPNLNSPSSLSPDTISY